MYVAPDAKSTQTVAPMKKPEIAGLVLVALLVLVWPVDHTISVREFLIVASLLTFGWIAYRQRPAGWVVPLAVPIVLYAALTLWMVVVAIAISNETAWSLGEIRGQWLKGLATGFVGLWMGTAAARDKRYGARALTVLAAALALYVAYVDVLAFMNPSGQGLLAQRFQVLGNGPDKANYITNLFLCFLFAEVFLRAVHKTRRLEFSDAVLGVLVAVALLAVYVTRMRNGVAALAIVLFVLVLLFVRSSRHRMPGWLIAAGVTGLLSVVAVLGYLNFKSDPRWQTFLETAEVSWNTDASKAWLNSDKYPFPTLSDGSGVEQSAYARITAIKEGGRLVLEHPFGIGFGRNAYGHGLEAKYGEPGLRHSHSGLLDMAIGTGFPGAALWVAFLGSLAWIGWRRFGAAPSYAPLLLLLVVTDYGTRMVVDSIVRDHMLQQFMFLAGLLAVMTVSAARNPA